MQQQIIYLTPIRRKLIAAFLLPLLFSVASSGAWAKAPSALTANKDELKHYLQGKYKVRDIFIEERKDFHLGLGNYRSFSIGGEIVPSAMVAQGESATKEPRLVAKAFLSEEVDFLGFTAVSEMKMKEETQGLPTMTGQKGFTHLTYDHFLSGLRLYGAEIVIHISPNGEISSFNGNALSTPPALLEAVKQPGLPQTEIRRAIKKDLIANGLNPDKVTHLEDEKYAIPLPPYVVWEVRMAGEGLEYALTYVINAFTGQIIRKNSSLQD